MREMTCGLRKSPFISLTDSEIRHLKGEIAAIGADDSVFMFNAGAKTGYDDKTDKVFLRSDIFPNLASLHPRDLMSERAVLAHEYYGHRVNRGTKLTIGAWNDEFRASYMAAKNAPGLSHEDRRYLILDAIERASKAGIKITYNDFMRRAIYGY